PKPTPALAFTGPDGKPRTLDDLKGRTVLLNLWATWCAPCKAEMPALDRLQGALGGPDFEVVALNVDTRNPDRPPAWLR
ncbi:TlpA disulfide reductase family protein, partial [Klebsiella pneumoniae]|uniref:TlpA disulfide reductase family protein n=1 Tax=Klebsiella pneumoniae TaxID=573 RepID=UPI0040468623